MITAIIPARSGSKRLKDKNIRLLNGRPLIFHTLDAVIGHQLITEVIFTTDSEHYSGLVNDEYGDRVSCILRPKEYAGDTTKVYDEIRRLHAAGEFTTEWYMQCLPTAPLRDHRVVRSLLKQWQEDRQPYFTCMEYDFPVQFAFSYDENMNWHPTSEDSPMLTGNTRSQDIPKYYRPNGAVYLQHIDNLGQKTLYINSKVFPMAMGRSIDVDTEYDFKLCEYILQGEP
jgi:CMP-N,N'-diacetyllegionaminic acid synthase